MVKTPFILKKKLAINCVFALFCYTGVYSQAIKSIEIDKFTGKKRIHTEQVLLKSGFSQVCNISFRSVDTLIFLNLSGTWGVGVVGENDPLTLLFDDSTTIKVYPTSIQSYDVGYGKYEQNSYSHQYFVTVSDMKVISVKPIVSARRVFSSYYTDADVKPKNAKKIMSMAGLLLNEILK